MSGVNGEKSLSRGCSARILRMRRRVEGLWEWGMSWQWCAAVVLLWSLSVSASRIYLGMHTLLDVVCGALLGLLLLVLLVPTMGALDEALLTRPQAPVVVFCFTLAAVAAYPATATWNPARGDTAVILGVGCGTLMGAWLNFQTGVITPIAPIPPVGPVFSDDPGPTQDPDPLDPRYPILWPSGGMVGLAVGRTLLGLLLILLVRCVVRPVAMKALCAAMHVDIEDYLSHNLPSTAQTTASPPAGGAVQPPSCPPVDGKTPSVAPPPEGERVLPSPSSQGDCPSVVHCPSQEPHLAQCPLSASPHKGRRPLSRVQHCFIECGYKFLTYICIGLSFSALAPAAFRGLGIERPTFCTEV
ncbi:uncharacterized protein LOC108670816 [Hyalella azteca]|uniref:Uncharacterized protein LOC108670816 n=1 Tax=Hyalella azteca TaxID=294128 RepID=A0A979FW10_HYAAZ|nr:uncharacterized protein LOC108670816 [Hyalella azteca]